MISLFALLRIIFRFMEGFLDTSVRANVSPQDGAFVVCDFLELNSETDPKSFSGKFIFDLLWKTKNQSSPKKPRGKSEKKAKKKRNFTSWAAKRGRPSTSSRRKVKPLPATTPTRASTVEKSQPQEAANPLVAFDDLDLAGYIQRSKEKQGNPFKYVNLVGGLRSRKLLVKADESSKANPADEFAALAIAPSIPSKTDESSKANPADEFVTLAIAPSVPSKADESSKANPADEFAALASLPLVSAEDTKSMNWQYTPDMMNWQYTPDMMEWQYTPDMMEWQYTSVRIQSIFAKQRKNTFTKTIDAEDGRRRREETTFRIREGKKYARLAKRRQMPIPTRAS